MNRPCSHSHKPVHSVPTHTAHAHVLHVTTGTHVQLILVPSQALIGSSAHPGALSLLDTGMCFLLCTVQPVVPSPIPSPPTSTSTAKAASSLTCPRSMGYHPQGSTCQAESTNARESGGRGLGKQERDEMKICISKLHLYIVPCFQRSQTLWE